MRLLAWQGVALAAIPIVRASHENDSAAVAVGVAVLALRAVALPWLLDRALAAEQQAQREATPLVNTATSLLITGCSPSSRSRSPVRWSSWSRSRRPTRSRSALAVVLIALFV